MPKTSCGDIKDSTKHSLHQTPKANTRRHSELSPDQEDITAKKHCQIMSEMNDELKTFMKEVKSGMSLINQKIDQEMTIMNVKLEELTQKIANNISMLTAEVKQVKDEITEIRAEVLTLEESNIEIHNKISDHDFQLNIIKQRLLENQLAMVNIAPTLNEESFLDDMDKWSGNILKQSLLSHNFSSNNKFKSKSAFLNFNTLSDKKKFMNFLKTKQKDANKKFIPILNENIFTLKDSDINRANVIEFRTPMTKMNRDIFNKARDAKKKNAVIEGVWISNGSVRIRIKNMKPIQINSVQQLDELFNSMSIQIPMN